MRTATNTADVVGEQRHHGGLECQPSVVSPCPSGTDMSVFAPDCNTDEKRFGTRPRSESRSANSRDLATKVVDDKSIQDTVRAVCVEPEAPSKHPFCPYILSPHRMRAIASKGLPPSVAYNRWTRLYCLARDGDSFESCLRRVKDNSRTLMVIRTTEGDIFGGYADSKWESRHHSMVGAQFYGGAQAFLFSILREEENSSPTAPRSEEKCDSEGEFSYLQVYKWTGANRYIQLCDGHHQMLAFGGGGSEGEFGLCVEDDFRRGSTGHCLTFDNKPLCPSGQFEIVDVEIWGFLLGYY